LSKGKELEISSINGNYFATFHSEIEDLTEIIKSHKDVCVLIDLEISRLYPTLMSAIPNYKYFSVESNEKNKSLTKVAEISEWLMDLGATKTTHLVGIGGGVVQDLSTFVSHIYFRGIDWTFFPTTLLSQADSCIGSKCALNLNGHKNQLGVVHTPKSVDIFTGFLDTLPHSEIQSGFGEVAKLAVTGKNQFLSEFKTSLRDYGISTKNIEVVIYSSLRAKKYVIDQDEYESDLRRVLNYGHSFGHALESLTDNSIVHGDAVIIGMDIINFIGLRRKIIDEDFYLEMRALFEEYFSHIRVRRTFDSNQWVEELKHDKKMRHGKMNFAIPVRNGDIRIFNAELDDDLTSLVGEYLGTSRFFNPS
jgi:3-dehydroquinate synthase